LRRLPTPDSPHATAHDGARVALRAATVDDIPLLQGLEVTTGRQFADVGLHAVASDEPPTFDALTEHISSGTAWVAEVSGQVVGYAVASIVDDEAHLDQVSVDPSMRGHSIGALLIDEVAQWGRVRGFDTLTLTTFADVPWNAPYYARLGFVTLAAEEMGPELTAVREREAWLDELASRVAMRLRLA